MSRLSPSVGLRAAIGLLLAWLACSLPADDIEPYLDLNLRSAQALSMELFLHGWPERGERVCDQPSSPNCLDKLGPELAAAAESLDFPQEDGLYAADFARVALYAALVDFVAAYRGEVLTLSVLDGGGRATWGPVRVRGDDWHQSFFAALAALPVLEDAPAPDGPVLESLDDCGSSFRFRPLADSKLWNGTSPRRLFPAWRSLLRGRESPGFSLAGPSLLERAGAQGAWYVPLAQFSARGGLGNVKKLRYVDGRLLDALGQSIALQDGRLPALALTEWTKPDDARLVGAIPGIADDGRDGGSVTRGGAGALMSVPRLLVTEHPESPGELLSLQEEGAMALLMPYLDPEGRLPQREQESLWRWLLGQDSLDQDGDGNYDEVRDWLMADVLHSRPVLLNYGAPRGSGYSASQPDVRVVLGGNDGMLRILRDTDPDGSASGKETFLFIPLEMLALQAHRAGFLAVGDRQHLYGLDGEGVLLRRDLGSDGNLDASEGDYAWLVIGQRRGGAFYYGFDLSKPDQPRLGWKIGPSTPGFEQLALGFSRPQPVTVDWMGSDRLVLLLAGGYNGGEGSGKDAGPGYDDRGNAIYLVDAFSGELLWRARGPSSMARAFAGPEQLHPQLRHGIASDLAALDLDGDGRADVAYAGDTGGEVWRLLLRGSGPASWQLQRLAVLGGIGASDRRFFHAPDIVAGRDQAGDYLALVLASGNRAAPLSMGVEDYVFLLKERLGEDGQPLGQAPVLLEELPLVPQRCKPGEGSLCPVIAEGPGWRFPLPGAGEKGLATPLTTDGVVAVTTYLPPDPLTACADPRGASHLYLLRLRDGRYDEEVRERFTMPDWQTGEVLELGPGIAAPLRPARRGLLLPLPFEGENHPVLETVSPGQYRMGWWHWGIDQD